MKKPEKIEALNGMMATHKYIRVNGRMIHYVEGGKGPLIIFVHSWNNDWFGFVPLIKKLHGFRVIALDLPGYGHSEDGMPQYSVSIMADVVAEFIKALRVRPQIVAGLSMGSAVVTDFGARYPHLAHHLVIMSLPIMKKEWVGSKIYEILMKTANSSGMTQALAKKIVSNYHYGHTTARLFNMYHYDKQLIDEYGLKDREGTNARTLFNMSVSMTQFEADKRLSEITIPTQLIFGKYDKLVDLEKAKHIAKRKKFLVKIIDDSGHVVCLEKPTETANAIFEFARKQKILK